MTYLEVKIWGDFEIRVTHSIMYHEKDIDLNELNNEFFKENGITSFDGNDYKILNELTDKYIQYLESKDFKILKTKQIIFSD